jgi:hypothetical protein
MSKNVTNETFQKHLGLLNKKLQLNEDISEVTTDGGSLPELALKGAEVIDVITSSDGKVHLRIKAANSTQLYDAVLV